MAETPPKMLASRRHRLQKFLPISGGKKDCLHFMSTILPAMAGGSFFPVLVPPCAAQGLQNLCAVRGHQVVPLCPHMACLPTNIFKGIFPTTVHEGLSNDQVLSPHTLMRSVRARILRWKGCPCLKGEGCLSSGPHRFPTRAFRTTVLSLKRGLKWRATLSLLSPSTNRPQHTFTSNRLKHVSAPQLWSRVA